ncbi:MAG: hypothetical protein AB7O65_01245 [Candidatus Korobacteraceae bacterium]
MKVFSRFATAASLLLTAGLLWAAVGQLNVRIQEWDVPTTRSRPHDPAVAPDGSLWYTGQVVHKLGRVDIATGQIREWDVTPKSGPHGLVADKDGNIWYTGNANGTIGMLNPKTGEVKNFPMPDPRARDPHTPIFDQSGTLWFTVQGGNMVGRLDPKTGKVDLKESPTSRSLPYGMVVNSKGVPWFCEFGTNKLASIDPKTMAITEYTLPESAKPRRIAVAADDSIYYTDYARGYLGRFDPRTGKTEEWASPGGPESNPYGIAIPRDGMVYYSESGVQPNTMVRFDPKSKQFSTVAVPSGGGVIRHMVATPKGDIFIACSGVNKVGLVEVSKLK